MDEGNTHNSYRKSFTVNLGIIYWIPPPTPLGERPIIWTSWLLDKSRELIGFFEKSGESSSESHLTRSFRDHSDIIA